MMVEIPIIRTAQLTLRPFAPGDAASLHRIYRSEGVLRYFPNPNPPPLERVERFIAAQEKHWEQFGYGNWAIQLQYTSELAGWAGLQYLPELNKIEVGFLLDYPDWGKGYATEAATASLRFGFERCRLEQIIALVHPDNLASQRVIQKCGLAYVDTISIWGVQLMHYSIQTRCTESKSD